MAKGKAAGKKTDRHGKIYREFTRIKFKKYKLQFPRLRESDIVTKIIREWEAMDEEAKDNLEKQYIERSGLGFLEEDESSSSKRRRLEALKALRAERAAEMSSEKRSSLEKKKSSPKVRVFEEKTEKRDPTPQVPHDDSDIKRSEGEEPKSGKKSTPEKESSSDPFGKKSKGITKESKIKRLVEKTKSKKEEYLTFFKYYFERLGAEHPRWSKNQISTIIKLLWKKRSKSTRKNSTKISKTLSGFQLYRRTKETEGFLKAQIRPMWKALPVESKRYWRFKAQGRPIRHRKSVRRVLEKGVSRNEDQETRTQTGVNWMSNIIQ